MRRSIRVVPAINERASSLMSGASHSRHRRRRATSAACSSSGSCEPGKRVRMLRRRRRRGSPRRRRARARRHPRRGAPSSAPARASTSSTTTSRWSRSRRTSGVLRGQRRRHAEPARGGAQGRRAQGRPHVVERGLRRARRATRSTTTRRPAPQEDYGRAKLAAEQLCREYAKRGPRRDDHPPAHDPRPRPARHHADPLRVGPARAGTSRCSARGDNVYQFVHARRPRRRVPRAPRERPGPAVVQHRRGEVRHDARDARGARRRHAGTGSRVVSVPMRARGRDDEA